MSLLQLFFDYAAISWYNGLSRTSSFVRSTGLFETSPSMPIFHFVNELFTHSALNVLLQINRFFAKINNNDFITVAQQAQVIVDRYFVKAARYQGLSPR